MSIRSAVLFAGFVLGALGACDPGAGRIDTACRSNADCAPDELCGTGFCEGGVGACIARPTTCPDTDDPVCGCDGLTYPNDCFASLAGIRLATEQPCICSDNGECQDGQFCALDDSCLNPGACLPTPETCDPTDTQVVCGCLGNTYDNACKAFQNSERVSALGTCECTSNEMCSPQQYCDAITCDGPGGCLERPTTCPPEGPSVTGCDGVVYDNECSAALQGVRVRPDN